MPFADLGGYQMHDTVDDFADRWTSADTILLQHGYCRSGRFWYPWVPALARQFKALRPDIRGCGESPSPGEDYQPSLDGFIADLVAFLDTLGLERVHYVGESFGGIIGLR